MEGLPPYKDYGLIPDGTPHVIEDLQTQIQILLQEAQKRYPGRHLDIDVDLMWRWIPQDCIHCGEAGGQRHNPADLVLTTMIDGNKEYWCKPCRAEFASLISHYEHRYGRAKQDTRQTIKIKAKGNL